MRKSLFRKYLLLISVIVFGSFIIMGAIFFVSMSNYWVGDKLDNLKENVETIAAYVGNKSSHEKSQRSVRERNTVLSSLSTGCPSIFMLSISARIRSLRSPTPDSSCG